MNRKLTTEQIRSACLMKLAPAHSPTVREVEAELRRLYGCTGRRQRVSEILRTVVSRQREEARTEEVDPDIPLMRRRLSAAEQRAHRAERLERQHQDFWARRYQEKLAELRRHPTQPLDTGVTLEQHVELYGRMAELARRLAKYEEVELLDLPGP